MNSINRSADFYGSDWPKSGAIPESLSSAGWTLGNEGFVQQTFLGCTIRDFTVNGEFGDSSSTLNVSLVPDEFNRSDYSFYGSGDDVYHNGIRDQFIPPPVGSPVFFKFGKNHCTIEQAWRSTLDRHYGYNTLNSAPPVDVVYFSSGISNLPENHFVDLVNSNNGVYRIIDKTSSMNSASITRGKDHFAFGGILQRYGQESSNGGDPTYNVTVVDPREILSNATMILNNYSNSTFNLPNLFNVFGLLEYNPTLRLREAVESYFEVKSLFTKKINTDGSVSYRGGFDPLNNISYPIFTDAYAKQDWLNFLNDKIYNPNLFTRLETSFPNIMPYTGTALSRRTDNGIPFYRVVQAMNAMMGFYGQLPEEYLVKGFGSYINFRGFNYVVDFSGMPLNKIPANYYLNFDQMTIMEFCQEVSDIISHDLYVSLIPAINHPATFAIYSHNEKCMLENRPQNVVAGIIRIDCIDRSTKPEYGAIKRYIDFLERNNVKLSSSNEGYELSNVSTDKFVVGAQEVNIHFFSTNNDRMDLELRKKNNGLDNNYEKFLGDQWLLSTSLQEQLIPFYGFLGKDAVTIPRGFGSYQQILLDATDLKANGVGNYYVATEIELRAALISYEDWKNFLLQYNDLYMEATNPESLEEEALLSVINKSDLPVHLQPLVPLNTKGVYGVTVPRCVFSSDKNYMGPDNLPASPCSPPFGYPLYYKRGSKIGFSEGGLANFATTVDIVLSNLLSFKSKDSTEFRKMFYSQWENALKQNYGGTVEDRAILDEVRRLSASATPDNFEQLIGLIETKVRGNDKTYFHVSDLSENAEANAYSVYEFVKAAASNLGRKFLVKIPKQTNPFYNKTVKLEPANTAPTALENIAIANRVHNLQWGPFGFEPRKISSNLNHRYELEFNQELYEARNIIKNLNMGYIKPLLAYGLNSAASSGLTALNNGIDKLDMTYGALKSNYNEISNSFEFNYEPEPQGGFFHFDLYSNLFKQKELTKIPDENNYPNGIKNRLFPVDITNFLSEQNRVTSYVRFDNSQFLDLSKIPKDSISQQVINNNGVGVPDISSKLHNTRPDKLHDFPNGEIKKGLMKLPKSTAFIKCDLDSRFYMSPKCVEKDLDVFGRVIKNIHNITPSRKIWDQATNTNKVTFPIYRANCIPGPSGGLEEGFDPVKQEDFDREFSPILGGDIVKTRTEDQDDNHVYALITLPEVITPLMDWHMVDGPFQKFNASKFQHLLTIDVVRGVVGFEKPGLATTPSYNPTTFNVKDREFVVSDNLKRNAFDAYQKTLEGAALTPNIGVSLSVPSPVYPTMVAIPLMSKERCYGPWISSYISSESARYSNIPGKVEFIKNETLSPWSYNGYDLMNEAGVLEATFSNSLLLFSENGSFTYNGLPNGNSLCAPLLDGGPLVTSISISITPDNGVQTTYSMSLFTARFGKLQKQKEFLLAKVSRERQRAQDERNSLIRKGIGKGQTRVNYELQNKSISKYNGLAAFTSNIKDLITQTEYNSYKPIGSVIKNERDLIDPKTGQVSTVTTKNPATSVQNSETVRKVKSQQAKEEDVVNLAYNSSEEENIEPVSMGPHNNMANFINPSRIHYS